MARYKRPPVTFRAYGKTWTLREERLQNNYGELDEGHCAIVYDTRQSRDQLRETITHELMHVIQYAAGMHHLKEQDIQTLASGWFALMHDNPNLMRWLFNQRGKK